MLVDQTVTGDFKPLEKVTTKVTGRKLDSAYEVYFSLYQQLVGEDGEEIFRAFDSSFFDLIIVDECHRGSAAADSAWRKILEYFDSAIQIGMTATPKETKDVSNIDYFGEPALHLLPQAGHPGRLPGTLPCHPPEAQRGRLRLPP